MTLTGRFLRDLSPGQIGNRILLLMALLFAPALVLAQAATSANSKARLASLMIEIWPEYDRAGAALVILKGELAKEVALPATVSLQLPRASGGPNAVAFAARAEETPRNLAYEHADAADSIAIRFTMPERHFQVEFYEPISTVLPARSYTFHWQGDLATEQMLLVVQEPATAPGVVTQPQTEFSDTGQNGLRYYTARLGPQAQGVRLPVTVRYTKTAMNSSVDILRLRPGADAPAANPQPSPDAGSARPSGAPFPPLVAALLVIAALALLGMVAFIVWRRRDTAKSVPPHGACTQCGAPRRANDRYCGKCGSVLG